MINEQEPEEENLQEPNTKTAGEETKAAQEPNTKQDPSADDFQEPNTK